jgi:hypothetical protein
LDFVPDSREDVDNTDEYFFFASGEMRLSAISFSTGGTLAVVVSFTLGVDDGLKGKKGDERRTPFGYGASTMNVYVPVDRLGIGGDLKSRLRPCGLFRNFA